MRQARTGHLDRIFGEQLLVGGFEIARALTYRDSTGGAAGPAGVGDDGDGSLTGFVLAQTLLQELEPDVFLSLHHHVRVVHAAVEEMRGTRDRDEQNHSRNRGERFLAEVRCNHLVRLRQRGTLLRAP